MKAAIIVVFTLKSDLIDGYRRPELYFLLPLILELNLVYDFFVFIEPKRIVIDPPLNIA